MPTILELAGLEVPDDLPGVSVAPWCTGEEGPSQDSILQTLWYWRAVCDGRYIYSVRRTENLMVEPWYPGPVA